MTDLVTLTPEGLYCPPGGFHIDPWRPVERALITHAHGDHARRGSRHYHAPRPGVDLLRRRLGPDAMIEGHDFGEPLPCGGATASFPPAARAALSADRPLAQRQPASQADRLAQVHALLPGAAPGGRA